MSEVKYANVKQKAFKKSEVVVTLCRKYSDYFVTIQNSKGQFEWVYPSEEDIQATLGYYDSNFRAANKLFRELTLKRCLEVLNK